MNLQSPITAQRCENALKAITTHGGTGTKHIASCLSFPDKGKETGVSRTQDLPIETYGGCEPNIRHRNRTTSPRRTTPARTHARAGTASGGHKRRASPQFTPREAEYRFFTSAQSSAAKNSPARTNASAGTASGGHKRRASPQFTPREAEYRFFASAQSSAAQSGRAAGIAVDNARRD